MSKFRTQFPFFNESNDVYLDSAATSQRLSSCLQVTHDYYTTYNANVHRGAYTSARKATSAFENARQCMARFIGAKSSDEVVFTSGATASINLLAQGLVPNLLQHSTLAGKQILLCESEHHANLLPWQAFAKRHNMTLTRLKLGQAGTFGETELTNAMSLMTNNVAILAIAHVSNALGNIYPVQALCNKAQKLNIISVIDGTQAAAHLRIDVGQLGCDFYAISGHKMYGPTGIGVLYGKYEKLDKLTPNHLGGEMIKAVTWHDYRLQSAPLKFEAGTPNIAGAIGIAAAAHFIQDNIDKIMRHEKTLYQHLLKRMTPLIESGQLHLLGNVEHSISLLSFYAPDMQVHDIASFLSVNNVAVRAGHHCAMPLMQTLNIDGCVRISLACYTNFDDIDNCVNALFKLFQMPSVHDQANELEQIVAQPPAFFNDALSTTIPLPIEATLKQATDWNSKHRELLLYSKQLNLLSLEQRLPEYEVSGCESNVWLKLSSDEAHNIDKNEPLAPATSQAKAYSDSKVVRGILAIILGKIAQLPTGQIAEYDFEHYLEDLGLSTYFSIGRRDGVGQIIKKIKDYYQLKVDL